MSELQAHELDFQAVLSLPRLSVQNVNAISSSLTWGFPSPTAFMGFVHALQRRVCVEIDEVAFEGVAIVCHHFEPQVHDLSWYQPGQFALTRNPVENRRKIDKEGQTTPMSIVEEGRAHMNVSLLIAVKRLPRPSIVEEIEEYVGEVLSTMRLAGGSIIDIGGEISLRGSGLTADEQAKNLRAIKRQLLPGFALVGRPDILAQRVQEIRLTRPDATLLDAVLDIAAVTYVPTHTESDAKGAHHEWAIRRTAGWLVPIPVGYEGISPLYPAGGVKHARDQETPFQFVESIYGVGQWIGPHRIRELSSLFWCSRTDTASDTYICHNNFIKS